MRRITATLLLTLVCVSAGAPSAAAAPAAEPLLPHKAVYELTLGETRASGLIVDVIGRMEFEWSDVCDGWAINQRFRIGYLYEDGVTVNYGWSLSSWESKDGKRYRFFIRRFDPSGENESVRGEAQLGPDGSGSAVYSEPERREVALPAGTLFPSQHIANVLRRAAGAAPVWSLVFDGTGEEGLMGISAALSSELPPGSPTQLASPLLHGQKSWQFSLAYYELDAARAEPEQEQALRLYANGVSDELRLDYGDFVLNADLTDLTALPAPDCGDRF
jgi:hypothetical protein